MPSASTTRYGRARGVVWRIAPDRVLVRRAGEGADGALDLFGAAAVVWTALDEPATESEIAGRLTDLGVIEASADRLPEALGLLQAERLVVEEPS